MPEPLDGQPWGRPWDAWTIEHDAWLREHAGTASITDLAAAISAAFEIDRTVPAVRVRAKVLGISLWRDGFTMRDLEHIFGVDHRVIRRWWIEPGLLPATRWDPRGPHERWLFTTADVERFIRDHGYAYDWQQMRAGHPLRSLAQVQAKRDSWITFDELAGHVGIHRSNLKVWKKRGFIPHKRRHKAGLNGWIMVRGCDVRDICERIHQAQHENAEQARAKFTAMRRAAARAA